MKNFKKLWILDLISFSLFFLLFGIFNPIIILVIGFLSIIPYLFFTQRTKYLKYFLVATLFGVSWSLISKGQYSYNQNFPNFFEIDSYLLLAWSSGLFAFYVLFSNIKKIQNYHFLIKLVIFALIYSTSLLLVETIAYHVFDIHNELAKNYPPIKFCNCIHGPRWVQISYFIIGPLYFTACEVINKIIKNKNS